MLQKTCFILHTKKHFLLSFLLFGLVNHSSSIKAACTPLASTPGQTIWTVLDAAQSAMVGSMTFAITQSDIPLNITQPGRYILIDTVAVPNTDDAITINTDNVWIDLNQQSIQQAYDTVAERHAININGHNNITIENGRFTENNPTSSITNVLSSHIYFGDAAGISRGVIVQNIHFSVNLGEYLTSVSAPVGMQVREFVMRDCRIRGFGFSPVGGPRPTIDIADLNQGVFLDTQFIAGGEVIIRTGTRNAFINCSKVGSTGNGFHFETVTDTVFWNCKAIEIAATGFLMDVGTLRVQLLSCEAIGLPGAVSGYEGNDASIFIHNCSARNFATNYAGVFTALPFLPAAITTANFWESLDS